VSTNRFTLSERLRYAFDNTLSRGTIALIFWLAIASIGAIGFFSIVLVVTGATQPGQESLSFAEAAWASLMRTLDSGTMGGDAGSLPFLLSMLTVTLGGIFIVSTLIGVLTSGLEARIDELRKGRSRVIESDHTVILNWSPHVFSILGELIIANENRKGATIVLLADKDKVEMEDELRERLPDTKTTRIVCRSGTPIELGDLDMVSVQTSRSIIVLAPEGAEDPDADVIKAVLAITNGPNRREAKYHIVAEIHEPSNMEAARLVGRDEAELVLAGDVISRITVQTCRQSGLSVVHTELLDFGGDEIYFKEEPALVGKTFGEALFAYETSTLLGLRLAKGGVTLNPPGDTRIGPGDKVIAISQDDDTIVLSTKTPDIQAAAIRAVAATVARPERTLILGWNWKAPRIVSGLDAYVAGGSLVTILTEDDRANAEIDRECTGLAHVTISVLIGDTTDRRTLEGLDMPSYDHIILLCSDTLPPQRADSRVLVTLLHLRDMGDKSGHDFSVVSEMLDVRNRALAEVTKADDFIVSEKLVSLMLAQISENKELNAVFTDLFDPDGAEIYVKPAVDYVTPGTPVSFYTVVEAARRRGEVAIGYKIQAQSYDAAHAYGVKVNPPKGTIITFADADKVIVLAES